MRHELAEAGLLVRVFDEIDLVDDVDEVLRLGDAPEHSVDAQPQLPLAGAAHRAEQQHVRLVQVPVRAVGVGRVVPKERRHRQASPGTVLQVEFRLQDEAVGMSPLAGVQGRIRMPAALEADVAGERPVVDPRFAARYGSRFLRRRRSFRDAARFRGVRGLVFGVHALRDGRRRVFVGGRNDGRGRRTLLPVPRPQNPGQPCAVHERPRRRLVRRVGRHDAVQRDAVGLHGDDGQRYAQQGAETLVLAGGVVEAAEAAEHRGRGVGLAGGRKQDRRGRRAEEPAGERGTPGAQRARLRPVWVNSRGLTSAPNT